MMNLQWRSLVALMAVGLFATVVFAQDPVALIAEDGTLPGLPGGFTVGSINNPAVNHSGGWAFNCNVEDGVETISTIWGNPTGGSGMVLRQEGVFPPYVQTSFESFWGMGAGDAICYSPSSNYEDGSVTGLDGVWIGDIPVAVEEMVFPYLADYWWSFGSRPGTTEDGIPYFVGGITDTQGGSTDMRGLFYGLDAQPVLLGGDLVPGLPAALTSSGIAFDFRFSKLGTHHIAEVTMDNGNTAANTAYVFDGEGLLIDGQLVQEGMPVPEAAGGFPGENWSSFDYTGVTENGDYMFTGDTNEATDVDEFVVINGEIILREGKDIGDMTLSGSIEGAFMNEDGDYVVIWDVDLPTGANVEAMIFNGEVVLKEGDIIDVDGDGVPDPEAVVDNFTGISSVVLSDRDEDGAVSIYFTADVDVATGLGRAPDGAVIAANDEDGVDEDVVSNPGSRAVLEFGYGLTFSGVVSAMLGEMDCVVQSDGVAINWHLSGSGDEDRLKLQARSDDRSWDVPFRSEAGGQYSAMDRLAVGGEVTYFLLITGADGEARILGEKSVHLETPEPGVMLKGAFPNPFNPATKVSFRVNGDQHITLGIYDLSGRLVDVLADEVFTTGFYQLDWNGRDRQGAAVPSGTYFARVLSGQGMESVKLMLIK